MAKKMVLVVDSVYKVKVANESYYPRKGMLMIAMGIMLIAIGVLSSVDVAVILILGGFFLITPLGYLRHLAKWTIYVPTYSASPKVGDIISVNPLVEYGTYECSGKSTYAKVRR